MSKQPKRPSKSVPKRKRVKIPAEVETAVLTSCDYRCCVCYRLQGDTGVKQGQIAHLDDNPSNSNRDNLIYLCHDHHSQYDSTSRQSKGLTEGFVRSAHERLQEHLRLTRKESVQVTIVLDRDYDTFTAEERAQFVADLHTMAKTSGTIRLLSISRGSVKVQLEVSGEVLKQLLVAQELGALKELKITRIEYSQGEHGPCDFERDFDFLLGVPTKQQALSVVHDPDFVQSVVDDPVINAKLMVKDSWPSADFATLVLFTSGHIIGHALVIPKRSLPACPVDRPRELLRAFAERFGLPIAKYNGEKIVFDKKVHLPIFPGRDSIYMLAHVLGYRPPIECNLAYWTEIPIGSGHIRIAVFFMFGEDYVRELSTQGIPIDFAQWKKRIAARHS